MRVGRFARLRISENHERMLVDLQFWLVQHQVPEFVGDAEALSHRGVERVYADD